jgi:hypothetical protein
MRYIRRQLEEQIFQAVKGFPAVVLTGPGLSQQGAAKANLYG